MVEEQAAAAGWPRVSVVIPLYNCGRYIARALDSVLAQDYPAGLIDIQVVDDGSSDDSLAIVERYAARDPRIRVQRQANSGAAAARNRGIEAGQGELIAFLDADDWWEPEKTRRQVEVWRRNPSLGMIQCTCNFFDADGAPLDAWYRRSRVERGDILLDYVCEFFLITSALLIPRHCLDTVGWFDESLRVGEDHDLFIRLLTRYHADAVEEPLLNRTVREDSLSRQDFDQDARTDMMLLDRFIEEHPEFYRRHARRIDASHAIYLYHYGYRLLQTGNRARARSVFLQSMRRSPSVRAAKAIMRTALPPTLVRALRPT